MTTSPKKGRRGASILLLSLVFMFTLLLLAVTLFKLIPAEMHSANRSHQDLSGHYVARAGIQETLTWLQFQMKEFDASQDVADLPDYNDTGSYDNINAFLATSGARQPFKEQGWEYDLTIEPHGGGTAGLSNNFEPKFFSVRSVASFRGVPVRQIDVVLQQQTFASFAWYTETFDPNTSIIMNGESKIFGPVHTNDFFAFDTTAINDGSSWSGVDPYFTDIVTHSSVDPNAPSYGDGNKWVGGDPYDTDGPVAGRYEAVFEGGRTDLRQKNSVDLPSSTDAILNETYRDTANLPTENGVYLSASGTNLDGGLYVKGDARMVNLRLDSAGNQKIVIRQQLADAGSTNEVKHYKQVSYNPKQYTDCKGSCKAYKYPGGPPSGGAGGGSGVGGADAGVSNPCIDWNYYKCEVKESVYTHSTYTQDFDTFEFDVYEVTEAPVSVTDKDGNSYTAQVGQTMLVERQNDGGWKTNSVQVFDGMINGNIYVDGNIGQADKRNDQDGQEGLWGIAKGTPIPDTGGGFQLDSNGKRVYQNKAIITPLDRDINLGGDLLQFNQEKFETAGVSNWEGTSSNVRNWTKAALDPNRMVNGKRDPERSPNNDHVLGVITEDLWMNGSKNNSNNSFAKERRGGDDFNDVYLVGLAGRTIASGSYAGQSSGGFGTYKNHRDNVSDGLGKFVVVGGIIQGTVSNNPGRPNWDTHHWIDGTGSAGWELDMFYDVEATRQRIFPVQQTFEIVRILETSAREG